MLARCSSLSRWGFERNIKYYPHSFRIEVDGYFDGIDFITTFTRDRFEESCADLFTLEVVEKVDLVQFSPPPQDPLYTL